MNTHVVVERDLRMFDRDSPDRRARYPIRVLVADDHERLRTGLVQLIGSLDDFEVVGAAADGAEAVRLKFEFFLP